MACLEGCELQIRPYDIVEHPFRPILTRAALEKSQHTEDWDTDQPWLLLAMGGIYRTLSNSGHVTTDYNEPVTRETDQAGQHLVDMYEHVYKNDQQPAFRLAYLKFLQNIVRPLFDGEPLVYQTLPNLRVHMPGNVATGKYHTDTEFGHPPEEVNFWVPVTPAFDTNALYVQTSADDQPISRRVRYGEYMIFDGTLPHGNEINTTGQPRVSFDFRVIREREYKPSGERSINASLTFSTGLGGYYGLLTDEHAVDLRNQLILTAEKTLENEETRHGEDIGDWQERVLGIPKAPPPPGRGDYTKFRSEVLGTLRALQQERANDKCALEA